MKPHPESIPEYSTLKVRTYLITKAVIIIISVVTLNRQVEIFQGQPLNIEGNPEGHMQGERGVRGENKEKRGMKGQNKLMMSIKFLG